MSVIQRELTGLENPIRHSNPVPRYDELFRPPATSLIFSTKVMVVELLSP